jgi:predicted RNA-binding Zn ribbon-like protein
MDSLWIDFVNSDHRDYTGRGRHEDRLEQEPWLTSLLERYDLEPINVRSRAARDALRGLRGLLRRLVTSIVEGRGVGDRDLDALNAYLAGGPVVSRLEREGESFLVRLEPTKHGLTGVLFRIASSFAGFLVDADPDRLKTCDNADCQWVFYDQSRSRTRRWCADDCGNLLKVRRFRARERKARS